MTSETVQHYHYWSRIQVQPDQVQMWALALAMLKKMPPYHDIRNSTTLPLLRQAQGSTWPGSNVRLITYPYLKRSYLTMTSETVQHYHYWSRIQVQPDQAQMWDLALAPCLAQIYATLPWHQKLYNTTITGAGSRFNLTRLKCETHHLPVPKKMLPYHDIRNCTTLPLLEQAEGSTWPGLNVRLITYPCLKRRYLTMTSETVQQYQYWSRIQVQPDQAQMWDLDLPCLAQKDTTLPWHQKLYNTTITGAGSRLNLTRLKCET